MHPFCLIKNRSYRSYSGIAEIHKEPSLNHQNILHIYLLLWYNYKIQVRKGVRI